MQDFKTQMTRLGHLATSHIVDKTYDAGGIPVVTISFKAKQNQYVKVKGTPSMLMRSYREALIDLSCAELHAFINLREEECSKYECHLVLETKVANKQPMKNPIVLSSRLGLVVQFPFLVISCAMRFLKKKSPRFGTPALAINKSLSVINTLGGLNHNSHSLLVRK